MLKAIPQCNPPFYETTAGSGVFIDTSSTICNPCEVGERWSQAGNVCVLDTAPSPGGGGNATAPSDFMKYALIGFAVLAVVGAFAGGHSVGSRKKSSGRLLSRTTTRSIFA